MTQVIFLCFISCRIVAPLKKLVWMFISCINSSTWSVHPFFTWFQDGHNLPNGRVPLHPPPHSEGSHQHQVLGISRPLCWVKKDQVSWNAKFRPESGCQTGVILWHQPKLCTIARGNHPIETTINNWLFGVPGTSLSVFLFRRWKKQLPVTERRMCCVLCFISVYTRFKVHGVGFPSKVGVIRPFKKATAWDFWYQHLFDQRKYTSHRCYFFYVCVYQKISFPEIFRKVITAQVPQR